MKKIIKEIQVENINKNDMVLDIETTGFSPDYNTISIIGYISYIGNSFYLTQIFSEWGDDKGLLEAFLEDLSPDHRLLSFNGEGFDLPFIKKRLETQGLGGDLSNDSLDLYRYLRQNKVFSPYPVLGQKKLEAYYGLERESDLDGKKAVDLYKNYLAQADPEIRSKLLYYNYLDVYLLEKLFAIYNEVQDKKKIQVHDFYFYLDHLDLKKDKLGLTLSTDIRPSIELSLVGPNYRLSWEEKLVLDLDLIHGLVSTQVHGSVFNTRGLEGLEDKSSYALGQDLILIKDHEYHLRNIKNTCRAILVKDLEKYKEVL